MIATEAVIDFHTELYHSSSIAANESDPWKVALAAERLTTHLDAHGAEMKAVATREGFTAIDR